MTTSFALCDRVNTWRHALSHWIECLGSQLSLSTESLPDRGTIERRVWIRFNVPEQSESAILQASGYAERMWREWLEALELFDLLARVDSAVSWTILHDLCDASERLTRQGCPTELFTGVQPKYEFCFTAWSIPTDGVMALVLDTDRQTLSPSFLETKSLLLAALPNQDIPPIRLRFHFALPTLEYARLRSTTQYTATIASLKRALALAKTLADAANKKKKAQDSRVVVRAFGFTFPVVEIGPSMRHLLQQIATVVPIFRLVYGYAEWQKGCFHAPFLWRLLAPHSPPRSLLGVLKLTLGPGSAHSEEIAAVVSAISQSRSLRELSFVCDATFLTCARRLWTAFLGFALFRKHTTHQIHTVHLTLPAAGVPELTRVLTEENPVTYLAALHEGFTAEKGSYSRKPLTTVKVNAQTKIVHDHKARDLDVKTVAEGKRDVECYVAGHDNGDYVRVLAPGIGFCYVPRKDTRCESPVSAERPLPVRSLTLRVGGTFDLPALASLLELIGEPLTELTLMNIGERIREPVSLDTLLQSCPRLKRLELSRVTLSLKTLIPTGWGRELESLTLRSCEICHSRWADPVRVPATMFPQLGSLYVDARDVTHPLAVPSFLFELAIARDLQRFIVLSDDPKHQETYQAHMQTHSGERIGALPLRHKAALLSALSAGGPRAKFQLNADVLSLIMEMVAPTIRTRVCTLL